MWRDTVTKTRERFNPRAPCGARRETCAYTARYIIFQPTRPLRGATAISKKSWQIHKFQPTRPLRGATRPQLHRLGDPRISTHAPLAGRDEPPAKEGKTKLEFQPTRPLRGATCRLTVCTPCRYTISTHAPLAGRDARMPASRAERRDFNPRAPCGARQGIRLINSMLEITFQPTRPLRGATSLTSR